MTINYPPTTEREFLKKYLEFSNTFLPDEQRLVPSEMELMIEFVLLPPKFDHQRFKSLAKDKVIEAGKHLGKNWSKLNINNKLYALLDKKFLHRDIDGVIYMPKHFIHVLEQFRKDQKVTITAVFTYGESVNTEEENRSSTQGDS